MLHRTSQAASRSFSLAASDDGETLRTSRGISFPIVAGAIEGTIDSHGPMLAGWARDVSQGRIPESAVIFVNGRFYEERELTRARREVVARAHFRDADQKTLWFDAVIPFEQLGGATHPELRVFAISGRVASELEPLPGFAYRGKPRD